MNRKIIIFPILFTFFVMGFCDIVGFATSYIKYDFDLTETVAGFIPSMVFIWFAILSIPFSLLMNRIGRRKTVQLSNVITFIGMIIPVLHYTCVSSMIAFVLLGIGNTMLQVSLNPLLASVVDEKDTSSYLTAGQVIKAISSFCGPFIAAFTVSYFNNWIYIFPIFAFFTFISFLLIAFSPIKENPIKKQEIGTETIFALFKNKSILLLFLGIFAVVGIDIGMNTVSPKLMIERASWTVQKAALAASVYFICRTVGAFLSTILLSKVNDAKYFLWNILGAILSLFVLVFVDDSIFILVCIGLIGFFCSSLFPIIFSYALKIRLDLSNEISGLMITGIAGGAFIPPLMGVMADTMNGQIGSLMVILICMIYTLFCSMIILKKYSNIK